MQLCFWSGCCTGGIQAGLPLLFLGCDNCMSGCLRYIATVKYLVDLGFYVNVDFHSIAPDPSIANFTVRSWGQPLQ